MDDFVERLSENQKQVFWYLNNLLISFPGIQQKIRYKIPFYYRKHWVCYINPLKDNSLELAFINGSKMANEQGLLKRKGRKMVSGITFTSTDDYNEDELLEILHEAFILDDK
jgi:hypothetical protein